MTLPRPTRVDVAVALILCASLEIELATTDVDGPLWLNLVAGVFLVAPLAFRSVAPVAAFACFGVLASVISLGLTAPPNTATTVPCLILACYSLGSGVAPRRLLPAAAAAAVAVTGASLLAGQKPGEFIFPIAFFAWAPIAVGAAVRNRRRLVAELAAKSAQLERDREGRARRAVQEERTRIARELHDLVAHSVSVMVVQSGAARRLVDENPARAASAALMIEATGREALTELRRLLGVLRRGDEELALAPQPSLRRVEALVERSRAAGLDVELRVEGDPAVLSTVVDLAAYRIVQEALTNTMKHSGGGTALVLVRYGDEEVEVEVSDTGHGPHPGDGDGRDGHGLIGMRERVALVGGELEAGRRREGGFAVRARLPREPVAA